MMDRRNCPKHVAFHFQNKFEKLVHLVGFIIRKFIAMHGHMNVKVFEFAMAKVTEYGVPVCRKVVLMGHSHGS
jgi:hypothetical protein